jgi:hypothetical protein
MTESDNTAYVLRGPNQRGGRRGGDSAVWLQAAAIGWVLVEMWFGDGDCEVRAVGMESI